MVEKPGVDRRKMNLNYQEYFSGGVSFECVAVNQATPTLKCPLLIFSTVIFTLSSISKPSPNLLVFAL